METGFGFPPSPVVEVSLPVRAAHEQQQHGENICAAEPSAVAWCMETNLIACAASPSVADSKTRERPDQPFSIAVHLVDPGYPSEHTVLHAPTASPSAFVHTLAWSPLTCQRALLAVDSSGSGAIWVQPTQAQPNVARSVNAWQLEHTWQQEPLVLSKWLSGPLPYRLPGASIQPGIPASYEERFLARDPLSATRWPWGRFLCLCSVSAAGVVHLRWRQLAPVPMAAGQPGAATWHVSQPLQLCCGVGGIEAADAIVTGAGSLVIAAVSHCQPSTVVLWEVTPPSASSAARQLSFPPAQQPAISASRQLSGPAGMSPLVAHLQAWEARPPAEGEPTGPALAGTVLSSFGVAAQELQGGPGSAGGPEVQAGGTGEGAARVAALALDPSVPGTAIVTVTANGGDNPHTWTVQRWESSRRQVSIHPTFDSTPPQTTGTPPNPAPPSLPPALPLITDWTSLATALIEPPVQSKSAELGNGGPKWVVPPPSLAANGFGAKRRRVEAGRRERVGGGCGSSTLAGFSTTGQELVVSVTTGRQLATTAGEVAVLHGRSLVPIARLEVSGEERDRLGGGAGSGEGDGGRLPCALSPAGCGLAVLTEGAVTGSCLLQVMWLPLQKGAAVVGGDATTGSDAVAAEARLWERQLADRMEWSFLTGASHWDVVAACHCAAEHGLGSVPGLGSALDADFYLLPSSSHRLYYTAALDRVKARLLEGVESEKARPVLLDIQARLLLDFLYTAVRALMVNPHTIPKQPWVSVKEFNQQSGADAMTVHPPLISTAHNYADTVLDLGLYVLTRLRRLAGSYARTTGGTSQLTGGGSQVADRLKLDRSFLQRLVQLAFFAIALRKRNPPLPPPVPPHTGPSTGIHHSLSAHASALRDDPAGARPLRLGNGNGGQGYTTDESRTVYMALADLVKKMEKCIASFPNSAQLQANATEIRLHYPEGQINFNPEFFDAIFQHHAKMPRPRGADAAGVLTRELELHPPSEDWSFHWDACLPSPSPAGAEDGEEVGRRSGPGSGLWPGRRRAAERNAALGLKTVAGMGDFLGFMGSRRDVIMSSWRTMPEHSWHKCTNCGRQTAALALTGAMSHGGDCSDPMALWQMHWASRWNEECPICGGRWMRVA